MEEYLSSHLSEPLPETFKRHVVQEIHLLKKASGSGAILGSNRGGLPLLGQPVWHREVREVLRFDFCKAVYQILMPDYIKLPQGDDLQEVLRGFRQRFPQCAEPIDGSSAARVRMTSESH